MKGTKELRQEILQRRHIEESLRINEFRLKKHQAALLELATSKTLQSDREDEAFATITEVSSKALDVERVSIWLFHRELRHAVRGTIRAR